MVNKEELIKEIEERFTSSDYGCYVGGNWFSPERLIKLIEDFEYEKD